jgi:hypothetical protein
MITSTDIIHRLNVAIRSFGASTFEDKGPREVMDIPAIVEALNAMPVEEAIKSMEETCNYSGRGMNLVGTILIDMQDVAEERWDKMMANKTLASAYDG